MNEREQQRNAVRNWQKQEAIRQQRQLRIFLITLGVIFLIWLAAKLFGGSDGPTPPKPDSVFSRLSSFLASFPTQTEAAPTEPSTAPVESIPVVAPVENWKLLLVNAQNPVPAGFTVQLKALRNDHQVDERIYPELQQMFDAARADGIYPLINESYRTAAQQQKILEDYIASYKAQGLSQEEAEQKARSLAADPGASEHQTGLALDIIAEYDADHTATWQWLQENSWRYGFILRYPAEKVAITGIDYEPWHFRYVGCPAAEEITKQGLCLEEYVERFG